MIPATYIGNDLRLRGKTALIRHDVNVLAQFDDMSLKESHFWWPFNHGNFRKTTKISNKYKWVVNTGYAVIFLCEKPRKVPGGYMDRYGKRWIGANINLIPRNKWGVI